MEKKISTNQTSLILVLFTVALKLSVLPALMTDYAGKNSYIVCLIAIVIDFIATLVIVSIIQKVPDKNFFQLISETLSKPVAIIVYIFLFIYFLIKCIIALLELHNYYIASLFEDLNPIFFFSTLGLLLGFMFSKSFRSFGRMLEIFFWPMAIGISFTLLFPAGDIKLTNILPLFEDGLYPIWNGLLHTTFAFGDYMVLFILMGNIDFRATSKKKILLYVSSILLFIFQFYIVFVGAFGDSAVNKTLAVAELPLHNPYPSTIGRLEWLTIIIWTAILIIQSGLLGKCMCHCFDNIFSTKNKKRTPIVISIIVIAILLLLYLKLYDVTHIATSAIFAYFAGAFQGGIILILIISYIIYKKKSYRTNTQFTNKGKKVKSNAKYIKDNI